MNCWSQLKCGAAGTVLTAICCFTPALALLLGAAGLSAWLGWADYVLFPLLAGFIGLTAYAAYQMRRECGAQDAPAEERADAQARQRAKQVTE